jgi:ATP-dependent protease ClpP protease subunit
MGSLILQAADKREMAPHSRFMIHLGSWGTHDHPKISYKQAEEGKLWDQIFLEIYLDKMMAKDEKEREAGNLDHMEKTLSALVNKHNAAVSLTPKKNVKYKFSQDATKRRDEISEVLQFLLDFDTFTTPEETVALGFADNVIPVYD